MYPVLISSCPRAKSVLENSNWLWREVNSLRRRQRVVRVLDIGLRYAQLRLVFWRCQLGDHLALRDAMTFIDGDLGKPARIFRGDVELGRFYAPVRLDDAIRQRLAAEARDQISDDALSV